jgi:SAM-dependent methyltransferase
MAFVDHWEIKSDSEIWPLIVGKDAEDSIETEQQVAVILDGIPKGGLALEIGAGIGRLLRAVYKTERFGEVVGVDSSMSMQLASQEYLGPQSTVYLNDGINLPFPDENFDFVYSFTAFQHMVSLAIVHRNLNEIQRVLKVGGLCRIQTISSNGDDPRDLKTYDGRVFISVDEFADQFRDVGLEVIATAAGLTHPKHIWVTARKAI